MANNPRAVRTPAFAILGEDAKRFFVRWDRDSVTGYAPDDSWVGKEDDAIIPSIVDTWREAQHSWKQATSQAVKDKPAPAQSPSPVQPKPVPAPAPAPKKESKKRIHNVAQVTELAHSGAASGGAGRVACIDPGILSRIRKALSLSAHEATDEDEAKAALRMTTKIMQQVNITQADLLAAETVEQQGKRAGASEVKITSTTGSRVVNYAWVAIAHNAVSLAFDVKAYTTSFRHNEYREIVFYGLAANTVAAAYSFEMVHNLILELTHQNSVSLHKMQEFNSYRVGLATGMEALVEETRRSEEQEAKAQEKRRQKEEDKKEKAERERTAHASDRTWLGQQLAEFGSVKAEHEDDDVPDDVYLSDGDHSSDNDEDGSKPPIWNDKDGKNDLTPFSCDDNQGYTPEASTSSVQNDEGAGTSWESMGALSLFRNSAQSMADSFLQESGIEVENARKRKFPALAQVAFRAGKKMGREIDVKGRMITKEARTA